MASKYLLIASDLYSRFPKMLIAGNRKLPSESELCKEYNCSRQTVRAALEHLQNQNLIIKKNGSGSYIRSGRIGKIAILLPSLSKYIFPEMLSSITRFFADYHFDVIAYSAHQNAFTEREILKSLLDNPPAGILIEPAQATMPCINSDLINHFKSMNIPIVFMRGSYREFPEIPVVMTDERLGTDGLLDVLLKKNCRRIYTVWMENNITGQNRYSELSFSCLAHGLRLEFGDELWISGSQIDQLLDGNYSVFEELDFSKAPKPFAVIAQSDELTYHLVKYLSRKGFKLKEDYLAAGYDHSPFASNSSIPLSSIGPTEDVSLAAAQTMLTLLTEGKAESYMIPTRFFPRSSTD